MNKDELKTIAEKLVGQHAKKELAEGFLLEALHVYDDESGELLYFRIRLKHPDSRKWIRPFYFNNNKKNWDIGEPKFTTGKPLYHLSTLIKNTDDIVWIVEGEQKVDLLEKFGFLATTSGSSTSALQANWEVLRGRFVIIWRDSDEEGLSYSQEVTKILKELNCTIRYVDVDKLNLNEGDDVVDWIKENPNAARDDLLQLPMFDELLDQNINDWPEITSLTSIITPEPYPLDALPETIRAAVIEVQEFTKAPIPLVVSSALAAISLTGQTYVDVKRAEKLCGPTGLFLMTIADSGERKSTCDSFFMQAIYRYEEEQAKAARPLIKDYNAQLAVWKSKCDGVQTEIRRLAAKGKDTTSQESELLDLAHRKPESPRVPRLIYSDATPEALKRNLAMVWPSAGIISSEGGIVLGAHAMQKDSAMRNLATYNQGWDGKSVPTDRIGSESLVAEEVRLTMFVQVQEVTLLEFIARLGSMVRGIGYFARVLFSWPESTQGYRLFSEPPENWPHLAKFHQRITAILNNPPPIDSNGKLRPSLMSLSASAKIAWIKFHNRIESELHNSGELYDVRDVASKAADNAVRLAALFQIIEYGMDGDIALDSFENASLIILWHLNESRRFFGGLALPPDLADAVRLETWLLAYCQKQNVDRVPSQAILQCGPPGMRKSAALKATLQILEEAGRVRLNMTVRPKCIEINPILLKYEVKI
ncbi:MAG: DUF3987 domain-containing protein [Legionella sp.]|nr:DUF3987 domain-containing protein [Legionella sp.]